MSKLAPVTMMPDPAKLRPHPIAAEYPMCSDGDLENLKASIKAQGFLPSEPIVLFGNPMMTLDGRNRLKAAIAVGCRLSKDNFVLFTGTEAEAEDYSNAKIWGPSKSGGPFSLPAGPMPRSPRPPN